MVVVHCNVQNDEINIFDYDAGFTMLRREPGSTVRHRTRPWHRDRATPNLTAALGEPVERTGLLPMADLASGERGEVPSLGRTARSPGWRRIVKKGQYFAICSPHYSTKSIIYKTGTAATPHYPTIADQAISRPIWNPTLSAATGSSRQPTRPCGRRFRRFEGLLF